MRIELFGNKAAVRSVSVERTSVGLHVHIGLREPWGPGHIQGGSVNHVPHPGQERLAYDTLVFSDPKYGTDEEAQASLVEVLVIAETPQESELMRSTLRYSHSEKSTFSVVYLPFAAFTGAAELAELRT